MKINFSNAKEILDRIIARPNDFLYQFIKEIANNEPVRNFGKITLAELYGLVAYDEDTDLITRMSNVHNCNLIHFLISDLFCQVEAPEDEDMEFNFETTKYLVEKIIDHTSAIATNYDDKVTVARLSRIKEIFPKGIWSYETVNMEECSRPNDVTLDDIRILATLGEVHEIANDATYFGEMQVLEVTIFEATEII